MLIRSKLIYSRGRERLLIAVDLTFALYIICSTLLVSTGSDVGGPIFIAMAVISNGNNLESSTHKFVRERSKEAVETYVYNLKSIINILRIFYKSKTY